MKKTLSYPELWKKKQRELPVKGNPETGWQQMRTVLDQRMPVTGVVKKPFRLKVPKWGLHVLVVVSSVVAIYVGIRLYLSKQHQHPAQPDMQQIHRDSLAPAVKHIAPTTVAPAVGAGMPVITPGITHADLRAANQSKLNNDTPKREQRIIDSVKAPTIFNLPVRRDSLVLPIEVVPIRAPRDSAGPTDPGKKAIQKDTSRIKKNTPKKKKRSRVSIFF